MNCSQVKLSDTPAAIRILITNKPIPIRAPMQGLETLWPPRWNNELKENVFWVRIKSIFWFQFWSNRKNIQNATYLVNEALNDGDNTSKDRVKSKHNIVDFYWNQLGIVLIKIQLLKSYKIYNRSVGLSWLVLNFVPVITLKILPELTLSKTIHSCISCTMWIRPHSTIKSQNLNQPRCKMKFKKRF